ncbi:MAG TPA: hypothetical protein PKC39_07175 [Ferruginibacter sp.]|nr:hypothetical protein [Ferruginibacter sp.]HMP20723.1 hypothetical protein [Ferruginibacter sp.]
MKKIYLILCFTSAAIFSLAQSETMQPLKKQQDIEALKVAFLSKELQLTPEEAQQFWPVYNEYYKEMKTAVSDDKDIIETEERVLNLRKRYRERFVKVVGQERMNRMFVAEVRFRRLLIKAIRQRRMQEGRPERAIQQQGAATLHQNAPQGF